MLHKRGTKIDKDFMDGIRKMYRATDIAKWFILKGIAENSPLTPMQVLKLTYIAQGLHLAYYNESLFSESCQAWQYGPVIPSVYHKTKKYKSKPINEDIFSDLDGISKEDKETLLILNNVWESCGKWSASQLSNWSHREGSAWDIAYNVEGGKNYLGYDIAADLLQNEFKKFLKEGTTERQARPGWN